jgi:hypothetical protein
VSGVESDTAAREVSAYLEIRLEAAKRRLGDVMANPWDRQARETILLSKDVEFPCPVCGETTRSLKQYQFLSWGVFFFAAGMYQTAYYRACPGCMRKWLAQRTAINMIPTNILWPFVVVPWAVVLFVATYSKGHTPELLRYLTEEGAAAHEARRRADRDVLWARAWAIVAILFCWAPVIGLPFVLLAYFMNRRAADWRRMASRVTLIVSLLIHLFLIVHFLG